ncbi:MAG: ATP-binding protein, partial [Pseudoruegeria sp.]
ESDFSADKYDHLDDLPVSILLLDKSFSVKFANSSARKLLKTESSLVGIEAAGFLEGINRPLEDWLFQGGATFREPRDELLKMRASDQEIFVHATVLQKGADLMMVLNDVTELKTLEAQFVQSQKMQAIGQLAGGIAHDFNNLLTAISGHCDLLLLRHDHNDPSYADLEQISQNANRAASLVGQLLAFSRKQTMQMQPMDLKDVFSDLTHLLNRLVGEKVSLRFGYDPEIKPVFADKRQLEQVMMNLVVNAKEAMPDGGEISIETTGATLRNGMRKGRVTIPPADYCVIKVTDNGVGIPTDNIDKVFDPFFTDKPIGEGTGLGLATVYGIVKQTGGYILIDSAVGQGTCFTLYLPVASEETVDRFTVQPKALEKPSPADEGVVLLVEDEDSVRAFASRALRLRGYTVLEAEDAERAKAILDDDSLSVDVFVSDVIMPGANGPTWVREALAKRPNVKVIFVSGYTEEELSKEGEMVPNSVFLPKPFSLNDLTSTVHRQLH